MELQPGSNGSSVPAKRRENQQSTPWFQKLSRPILFLTISLSLVGAYFAVKAASDFEKAAKISLDLATQQLQTGQTNILLLLAAQTTYQQSVIALVQAQANRLSDTVALYQALGGGWWNRDDLAPAPAQPPDPSPAQTHASVEIPKTTDLAAAQPDPAADVRER